MPIPRIMVVEDENIVNADIQSTLKALGYEIAASATSGEQALSKVGEARPDLILMDIMLRGDMDGVESAEQIRHQYNIPIVFLTAYSDDATLQRAKITEPFGYVIKPFEERELHTNIEIALHKHKIEMELRESRQWFSTVLSSIGDGVIATDNNGSVSLMNPVAEFMTGWDNELALGRTIEDVTRILNESTKEEYDVSKFHFDENNDRIILDENTLLEAKGGAIRSISGIATAILDDNGKKFGSVIIFRDISDRKLAEKALRASEKFNRDLVNQSPIGILYLDISQRVEFINPAFAKILSIDPDEYKAAIGRPFGEFINLNQKGINSKIKKLFEGEIISVEGVEKQTASGKIYFLNLYGAPRFDSVGDVIGGVIMSLDMTDYIELENQFRQAQKMKAIGALSGGIAHDFNNILTLIKGNAELAMMKMDKENPVYKYMERVQNSVIRGTGLTKELLLFGRRQLNQTKVTSINLIIKETVMILERTIDPRIKLNFESSPDLWNVSVDIGKMSQVFMNLCLNARDAMPEGGNLTIRTENSTVDEAYCKFNTDARPGDYVKITVSDSGFGIPEDNIEHIFEPFFTTKEYGKGTGLGLSVVYGIVHGHNGWITIDSVIDEGTHFTIFLPKSTEETDKSEESSEEDSQPPTGGETILLVDDDLEVRSLGQTLLEKYGYKVVLAEDGEEGVVVYRKDRDKIDLVILDLYMPRKSGRDALVEILEINPKVKVIIYSGFNKVPQIQEMLKLGAKKFIQKPYRMKQLLQDVRDVIDGKEKH